MTDLTVTTTLGRVRGRHTENARCWLGIPYAAAPTGALRWRPPQPHAGWADVLDAAEFGASSLQHASHLAADLPGGLEACREDCLTLNVFAPATPADEPMPVMIWIHGGGFALGGSSQSAYQGQRLASDGRCLVVTINYRLGVLGFLRLADVTDGRIPATGNEGLLDQLAAIEWMKANAAAFGGDPDNITAFGESAGAISVAALLAMPAAAGSFQRAIMQSGSGHAVHDLERANRVAELFLGELPPALRADPMRADRAALVHAAGVLHGRMMFDERLSIMPTRPVIDDAVLPVLPAAAFRDDSVPEIPVMIGCTLDEWRYYLLVDKGLARLDHDGLMARLRFHFSDDECAVLLDAYGYRKGDTDPALTCCAITGDAVFGASSRAAALALSSQQPVYRYRFEQPAPGMGGRLGACHTAEIPFVFGTLDAAGKDVLFEDTSDTRRLSRTMRWTWSAFARDGKPDLQNWPALNGEAGYYRWRIPHAYEAELGNDRIRFWKTISDERLQAM